MKKKRIIFITLGVIIVLTIGHFALSKPIYTLGAKIYLANKYSWNIKDIETVKYQRDYFDSDFGFMFLDSSNSISYNHKKWIFRYKKRDFNVERYHLHYADDYQLEDIFKWCTEYLQENVDKDITGVEIDSNIIFRSPDNDYKYNLPWNSKRVFIKNDAKKLLDIQYNLNDFVVFYHPNDLYKYISVETDKYNINSNENYYSFKKEKQALLNGFANSNIVIISRTDFERDSIGVFCLTKAKQSILFQMIQQTLCFKIDNTQ